MLHEEPTKKREQISLVCIDELVPQNHLLRKIDRVIDWSFLPNSLQKIATLPYCSIMPSLLNFASISNICFPIFSGS
jgi:hypothetical protein